MIQTKPHHCESCRGSGKLLVHVSRVLQGRTRTQDVLIDCPGKLSERMERPVSDPQRGPR